MNRTYNIKNDPELSESYYFNFYDIKSKVGGLIRLSSHPNKKIRKLAFVIFDKNDLYIKTDKIRFSKSKLDIRNFGINTKSKKCIKIKYKGGLYQYNSLNFPSLISFLTRKKRNIKFNLSYLPLSQKISYSKYSKKELVKYIGSIHHEITCKVRGILRLDYKSFKINAEGIRDYSYGPRRFDQLSDWFWTNFTLDNRTYSFFSTKVHNKKYNLGLVYDKQNSRLLKDIKISKKIDSNDFYNNIKIKFVDRNLKKEIKGEILYHIRFPLVFNKNPLKLLFVKFIKVLYVAGLTKYTLNKKNCVGYSEILINKK